MSVAHQALKAASAARVDAGLVVIRKILTENTSGLTTQELYRLALKEKAPSSFRVPAPVERYVPPAGRQSPPEPPHPQHPIHSMSFLKHHILPVLEQKGEFRKSRITRTIEQRQAAPSQSSGKGKRKDASASSASSPSATVTTTTVDAFVWRPFAGPRRIPDKALQWPQNKPLGEELGIGEDWSHLNKRRQRARTRKLAGALEDMKEHRMRGFGSEERARLESAA
ncbi:hypothetical protein BDV98DRAFT_557745 [Pterulicium gracile]|uniref:Uncharacterized protein n=1 Tax=Pterulicium gracile TaxID=1884261 RepID=A0A5C3QZA7_9AGAR|nr:hypothetical protein BDV98DRAFT_557745 [Pterula gracilis]